MDAKRWQQIEDIFQTALDLPDDERDEYVRRECGDDLELLAEVKKLVARYETDESFLESPVWTDSAMFQPSLKQEIASSLDKIAAPEKAESFVGQQIGVYRLTEELGRGGMGMVFLAERADGEFKQKVAVKLIKRGMDSDFIIRRFRHERQILAALNHPNIARLLDGGTTADDLPYFVMEYVEGKSFFKFCAAKKFDLRRKIELFLQVCSAIAYAHKRKIIHRDIKPTNILVTDEGTPKLLDFGIAKILDPDLIHESISPTATQMRLMTPEYASPEQVKGDEITTASDQYSLGILLYELITGKRPYKFSSRAPHEIARIICEEEPSQPSSGSFNRENVENGELAFSEDFCKNLDRIVLKTLRKNPVERYNSVEEFAADLKRFLRNESVRAESFAEENNLQKSFPPAPLNDKSIAVLPFKILDRASKNDTDDISFLTIGMADALITRLSNIRQLVVRPTSSVLRFGANDSDSFKAAHELNVKYILDGSILRSGDLIRISVQLLDVTTQSTVWAERFDEFFTDVLSLEDIISTKAAESLIPQLTTVEREKLAKRGTDSPEAYESYLRGRFHWNTFTEEGFAKAFVAYHEAIAHDPNYALAFAGIADYYNWLGVYGILPPNETYQPAKENAQKAVELDDKLAEAFAALGFAQMCGDFEWETSAANINRAIELSPNYAVAHNWKAIHQFTTGHFSKAIENAKRAVELDPLTYQNHRTLFWGYYFARRFDEALIQVDSTIKKFPMYGTAYLNRSWVLRAVGRFEEALECSQKGLEIADGSVFVTLGHAQALAANGRLDEAETVIEQTKSQSETHYISFYHIALAYCYAGETGKALDALEQAYKDREGWLVWIAVEPAFDFLRGSERFKAVYERIIPAGLLSAEASEFQKISSSGSENFVSDSFSNKETLIADYGKISGASFAKTTNSKTPAANDEEDKAVKIIARRKNYGFLKYAAGLIVLTIISFGIYQIYSHTTIEFSSNAVHSSQSWRNNFSSLMSLSRVTNNGRTLLSTVSADGSLVAFVVGEDDKQSISIRSVSGGETKQILAPATVLISGFTISPDNKFVYYTAWSQNYTIRNLYRVPTETAGEPQMILEQINNAIEFAPDGRRFAYVSYSTKNRQGSLGLADLNADGTIAQTQILLTHSQPNFIRANPAFSPDGKKILYAYGTTVEKKEIIRPFVYDLEAKTETPVGETGFGDVSASHWHGDGNSIILSAAEKDGLPYQIWSITYPNGEATKLMHDSSSYFGLSLSKDSGVLTTAKRDKSSNVWLTDLSGNGGSRTVTDSFDRLEGMTGVNWTADGKLIYVAGTGTENSIVESNDDGGNLRPIPVEVANPSRPTMTKDKRFIIFADKKGPDTTIWRYETANGNLTQLTKNYAISPTVTPDDRYVVYSSYSLERKISLHKIPIEGGEETAITPSLSAHPQFSPDGKMIACYYGGVETGGGWQLAVLSAETGKVLRVLNPPDTFNAQIPPERPLAWSPDNNAVFYLNDKGGVSNIFKIGLEDGTPVQITNFTSGRIFDFSISPDSKRAVLARGAASSDIVVFKSLK